MFFFIQKKNNYGSRTGSRFGVQKEGTRFCQHPYFSCTGSWQNPQLAVSSELNALFTWPEKASTKKAILLEILE